jgi:hypothetical protein
MYLYHVLFVAIIYHGIVSKKSIPMSIVRKTLEKISSTFFENNACRYYIDVHVLPLAPSRLGSLGDVADASLMGTALRYAETLFGATAIWRMAIVLVNVAIHGVLSIRWHALPRQLCLT